MKALSPMGKVPLINSSNGKIKEYSNSSKHEGGVIHPGVRMNVANSGKGVVNDKGNRSSSVTGAHIITHSTDMTSAHPVATH